jgi:putative inorganic carbon (HCO3(-)) transporter
VALALLGLAAVAVQSVEAWGPSELVVSPRLAALAVIGCCVAAIALASDPAWSFSAALGASMFSGHWSQLGMPGPVDRLLLLLGVAGLILRAPIEMPRWSRPRFVHVAVVAAALFAVASAYAVGSFTSRQGSFALFDRYGLIPFAAFLLAPLVFNTARRRTILLGVLTLCGAYLSLTALFEATGAHALVWPSYILDANTGIHAGRARGPFVEAGALGVALWGCGIAALVLASSPPRPWIRRAGGIVAVLCVLGVLFSLTRADWLAASIAGVVTLVAARELHRFVVPAIVCCVLAVGGALAVVPNLSQKVSAREQSQSPIWDRLNSDAAALRMVQAKPLLGFGWDTFADKSLPYYRISSDYPLTSVAELHNVFLSNAVELGLIGGLIWLGALVAAIGAPLIRPPPPGLRAWRNGLMAIAVMWVVVANFAPLAAVFPNLLLWTWAGVLWLRRDDEDAPELAPEQQATQGPIVEPLRLPLGSMGGLRAVADAGVAVQVPPEPVVLQPLPVETARSATTARSNRTRIMGIDLEHVDEAATIARVVDGFRQDLGGWICPMSLEDVRECSASPELRDLVRRATLIVAEDMALVWAGQLAGRPLPGRVSGASLVQALPRATADIAARVFVVGADPDAAAKAADRAARASPSTELAGVLCPRPGFERDSDTLAATEDELEDAQPDLVFVGLEVKQQAQLIQRLRIVLPRAWFISCRPSFGAVPRPGSRFDFVRRLAREPGGLQFLGRVAARALASRIRNERRREPGTGGPGSPT